MIARAPGVARPVRRSPKLQTTQKTTESSDTGSLNVDRCRTLSLATLGRIGYLRALDLQNALVSARIQDDIGDVLLLLEHPHVYTLGRGADERFVLNPGNIPVHRVSRGGQVTYHGPGQLVGYSIMKLEGAERDVLRYLRQLEQVLIEALAMVGIEAERRAQRTGVWVGQEKIASIGVGFRRWVSLHGFAVNVATDLSFFRGVVPCGIAGCQMTSIAEQGYRTITSEWVGQIVAERFSAVFGYQSVRTVSEALLFKLVKAAASSAPASDSHENGTKTS